MNKTYQSNGLFSSIGNKERLSTKIVHLGFGAFARAHPLLFTDEVNNKTASDWGICVINLIGGKPLIESLRAQGHNYTVAEKGADDICCKHISSIKESLHPVLDSPQAVLNKLAEPQVAVVSLTITEKGYCADPASGSLDINNPLIAHDLCNEDQPQSAIGFIVRALQMRRTLGFAPFTVMSCDNVQENGDVTKKVVTEFAHQLDPELAQWIELHVTFPCTMVDRIVPAVTAETLAQIEQLQDGRADPCAVACEAFRQWIIEDKFVAGRPDWNIAGAQFVENVVPYEEMKLRMLNGSHSFLAYLGYLAGYQYIGETMADENFRGAARALMLAEQAPSLAMPVDTDLSAYASLLLARYSNPNIKHQTWQIAMDGSQKIPQRFAGGIRHHLANNTDFKWLALGIAGWMRYVAGVDEQGQAIDVRDPMAKQLYTITEKHGYRDATVATLLSLDAIFPPDIGCNERVIEAVTTAYLRLVADGARNTVKKLWEAVQ
ncbi:fructuronate reductase [Neiella marina]|uniref:Fructuronate reductase n=1 Tax=Neiella holothuriorum TaxID=2870530 RepID=A0ABS7EE64_9GAMM|nr:fructuronate reductase [Neiella holothuriorum]MBW8190606.1 fructuronate reductase [Neiella holothuriorum]